MRKIPVIVLMMFIVGLMFSTTASALPVNSQLFMYELNQASDNSAEYLLNKVVDDNGTPADPSDDIITYETDIAGDSIVDVGDRLRGWFDIGTIEALTGPSVGVSNDIGGTSGVNEWSGIFELEVLTKTNLGGLSPWVFTFGPSSSFEATYGQGAMVAMFEDLTPDFSRLSAAADDLEPGPPAPPLPGPVQPDYYYNAAEEALLATATDGLPYWYIGFSGVGGTAAVGQGWLANTVSDDISVVGAIPPPGNGGTVNFGVDLLTNYRGPELAQVGTLFGPGGYGTLGWADFAGSANLLGVSGVSTPADNFDNMDVVFKPVPEPATMFLLGSGLIGLAGFARKKFRKRG